MNELEQHIEALINLFGYEPSRVRRVTISPKDVTIETFTLNDEGRKFIRSDGNVATDSITVAHKAFAKQPQP